MQEFDCEFKDKKGYENLVADHLSRIVYSREPKSQISECFPDEQLFIVQSDPWFADIVNYLVSGRIPEGWTKNDRDKFFTLSNSLSGMIHTCLRIVRTKFLRGVCLIMKLEVFSHFVMTKHVGAFQWEENCT